MSVRKSGNWQGELDASTVTHAGAAGATVARRAPGWTVIHHPDPSRVGEQAPLPGLATGEEQPLSRLEPLFAPPGHGEPRPLGDAHLSRRPLWIRRDPESGALIFRRPSGGMPLTVEAAPVASEARLAAGALAKGVVVLVAERVVLLLHEMDPLPPRLPDLGLVGESSEITRLRQEILRAADLATPVLIEGETGTGKELVAAAIHAAGPRRNGPFVAVNLAAVPSNLAAAELFGNVRGAFTGADKARKGHFRRAHGGTLFLDEVGEAPPEVQVLLLRALETSQIQPVGSDRPEEVDLRILAATDKNLSAAMADGTFRTPLYHRLSSYSLEVPPLRQRRDDIGRLLRCFLTQELRACDREHRLTPVGRNQRPWLPAGLVGRLLAYEWPGNVRQLRNVARQLAARYRDEPEVETDALLERLLTKTRRPSARSLDEGQETSPPPADPRPRTHRRQPSQIDEEELAAVLAEHRWRLQPTARALGISRTSLYGLIDRFPGLRRASEIPEPEIRAALDRVGGDLDALSERLEVSKPGILQRMRELDIS